MAKNVKKDVEQPYSLSDVLSMTNEHVFTFNEMAIHYFYMFFGLINRE
jgi:hypothetical protein